MEQLRFNLPKTSEENSSVKKFRYFGELKDVDSIYQERYDLHYKLKEYHGGLKKPPFNSNYRGDEIILPKESKKSKEKYEDIRNKTLSETKIFSDIGMYKFRNKKLDEPLKLSLLTPGDYLRKNCNDKIEKVDIILEIQKRRRDIKYEYTENMDVTYLRDVKRVMKKNIVKKEDERRGYELPEGVRTNDKVRMVKTEDYTGYDDEELDDCSSIDSDAIEEERKFRVNDGINRRYNKGVLIKVGTHNEINSSNTTSELLQHAQCFKFEFYDLADYERFHRPDLDEIFKEISEEKDGGMSNDMTTHEKLAMQSAGSHFAYENRLRNKIFTLPLILSSNARLKKKLKSK